MRKILSSLLLFVPILLFAAPAQPDTLRLLCIGNSFTEDAVASSNLIWESAIMLSRITAFMLKDFGSKDAVRLLSSGLSAPPSNPA